MKALILMTMLMTSSFALEFRSGDTFTYQQLRGSVRVQCQDQNRRTQFHTVQCYQNILSPTEMDYVVSEQLDADEIKVTSTWESGKVVKKDVKYDTNKDRSKKRLNLWIRTLFQRPLLAPGTNEVTFVAYKDGREVQSRTQSVEVRNGGGKYCPYYSMYIGSCTQLSFVCSEYFQRFNYCR